MIERLFHCKAVCLSQITLQSGVLSSFLFKSYLTNPHSTSSLTFL